MFSESCEIGNRTETMFDLLAQSKKWIVGIPQNMSLPYDRIISFDNGRTWHNIQIKTAWRGSGNRHNWAIKVRSTVGKQEGYHDIIDYIVANVNGTFYMFPSDVWYHCKTTYSFLPRKSNQYCIGNINIIT